MTRDADGIITEKYAGSGDVGLGGLSLDKLFTITYSTPGGLFPQRIQFNQLFRNLSALGVEINEEGPFLEYNNTIDYTIGAVVKGSNNVDYKAVEANGPATSTIDPVGDVTGVWISIIIRVSDYGYDLDAAVTAIGALDTTLLIDGTCTLAGNVTVPENIEMVPARNALFTGAFTLTIDGTFSAGLFQMFSSTITVEFGLTAQLNAVEVAWFGGKGDSVVENGAFVSGTAADAAINAAIASAQGLHKTHLHDGVFKITESIIPAVNAGGRTYNQGMSIFGNGYSTVLVNVASASKPTFSVGLNRGSFIKDMAITGVEANPNTGIHCTNTREFLFENVSLDPMGDAILFDGQQTSKNILRNINIWWDAAFWGTTDIRTISNTNGYNGISFVSTAGQFATQNEIDGLRVEGGAWGIYGIQATLGNSLGMKINNYINANTDRGIYFNTFVRIEISNWYIFNGSGGDYAAYFVDSPFVSMRDCRGDFGTYHAPSSIRYDGTNSSHISLENIYTRGDLNLNAISTSGGFSANSVVVIGDLVGLNPNTFRKKIIQDLEVTAASVNYSGIAGVDGSTIYNEFGSSSTDNDDTPSVLDKNNLLLEYSGGHTITDFTDGIDGQHIFVTLEAGSAVTIANNANIKNPGGGSITLDVLDMVHYVEVNGVWRCVSFSDNS